MTKIKQVQFEDIGFAKIDYGRFERTGIPEAVFCAGKTPRQAAEIFAKLAKTNGFALATRVDDLCQQAIKRATPGAKWHKIAGVMTFGGPIYPMETHRYVAVVAAGTGDIPVAEEAKTVLEFFGIKVKTIYDAGVAGFDRLLEQRPVLEKAAAVIATAGMDGVCPIVTAGLCRGMVVGVPTKIGYGIGEGGAAALISMLNSCVPGLVTVNIGNGFGAACAVVKALKA